MKIPHPGAGVVSIVSIMPDLSQITLMRMLPAITPPRAIRLTRSVFEGVKVVSPTINLTLRWISLTTLSVLWMVAPMARPLFGDESVIAEESGGVVEISAEQLTQIQSELLYLRQKEDERSARENARLSLASFRELHCDSGSEPAPCGSSCDGNFDGECGGCDASCDACQMVGCDSRGGLCGCLCHGCVRPICPAPCLECPRVSTLNPYFNVQLFGALKLDMFLSNPRAFAPGVPFFLTARSAAGVDQDTVSIHARQSTVGAAFTGPQFGGFQSGGQIITTFFNDSVIEDNYGLLPLQAFGELKNDRWRFAAGLLFDVFAPGAPTVLPFSILGSSGNAGNSFRGQLRLERYIVLGSDVQWTLQGALSDPITSTIDPRFRLLEDNGWPNLEGRLALGLGTPSGALGLRPIEIGISGVVGEIRSTDIALARRVETDVRGGAIDFRFAVSPAFGIAGEVFTGEAIGTYNAGVLQTINPVTLEGIRTSGGYIESYVYLSPRLHTHFGYGVDNPKDADLSTTLTAFQRSRNETYFTNLLWDVNQTFRVGVELTYRETDYIAPQLLDNQGIGFQTQFQWLF